MREWVPAWADDKAGDMSKTRYAELKAFCLQYPERKRRAAAQLGPRAVNMKSTPHGNSVSDPVFAAVQKREKLLDENAIIDSCLEQVADGAWAEALRQNLCYGKALQYIDPALIPSSHRQAFFAARRAFFLLLDEKR